MSTWDEAKARLEREYERLGFKAATLLRRGKPAMAVQDSAKAADIRAALAEVDSLRGMYRSETARLLTELTRSQEREDRLTCERESALETLERQLHVRNDQNRWLGVTAGVALCIMDKEEAEHDLEKRLRSREMRSHAEKLRQMLQQAERERDEAREQARLTDLRALAFAEACDAEKQRAEQAAQRIATLEAALRGLLLSADASWEEQGAGHDWRESAEQARATLGLHSHEATTGDAKP